jgi:2-polyprenyl-6-methoxyphenol hydroxylase-like FAD-dependent oxidoreductase
MRLCPKQIGTTLRDSTEILSETPVTELTKRFGVASLVGVHRADVQAMLLGTLGKEVVHPGARCVGCAQDEAGVRAYFADGQEVRGDILIGADGLHSVIRASLFDQEKPRYAGYTAWRGVTLFERKEKVFESWGSGRRFGFVPLTQGRVYWFATTNAPEGGADGVMGRKHALFNLFRGWHEPVEAVIEAPRRKRSCATISMISSRFGNGGKGASRC